MSTLNSPSSCDLRIHGMTCGACVQRVESALRRVPGVRDASVNLMTESASVQVENGVSAPALLEAVRSAGYDAEPLPSSSAAPPGDREEAARREHVRRQRQAMVQAIGLSLPILLLDHFGHALQSGHAAGALGWRILQLALMIMLMISPAGGPILAGGLRSAWHRAPNMDLLITTGVLAAVGGSIYGTFAARPDFIHFHAAALIITLVSIGRYLETRARGQAMSAIAALARRAPTKARVKRAGEFVEVGVEEVVAGDLVQVLPQSSVPTDGAILEGRVTLDESLITGEPLPVTRGPEESVRAGTLALEGVAVYRATQVGTASTLGRIVELVRRAQATRTPMQRLADRVAGVFTPIVIALALATLVGWLWWGGRAQLAAAISAAIAVLVVACPCAMGLATPTAVVVASGKAALRGILVRDAASLEALGQTRILIWDKTGTLTGGKPQVVAVRTAPSHELAEDELLSLAASAEQFSIHPLAKAVAAEAQRRSCRLAEPSEFEAVVGGGVRAIVDGRAIVIGNQRFVASVGDRSVDVTPLQQLAEQETAAARSVSLIAIDGRAAGVISFEDPPRPSAREAIERLNRLGLRNVMLTGDALPTASAIAQRIGITSVFAGASPQDKLKHVRDSVSQESTHRRSSRVAMVGDGVNDAAALAAADVGIAFATGADVAIAAAGINLIGSTPHLVADAVELARLSIRIIRENLFWAFFYNVVMLPLAALGRLPPGWAAGAMMLSSLTVVLNALRVTLPSRK